MSKSPTWTKGNPNNIGGNGNPGVAADVANTQYSIGYVELAYALQSALPYAEMQNAAGSFVTPTLSSVSAAASQFPNVSYQSFSIVNAPGSSSYPICGYSWALVYQKQTNQSHGIALGKLFDWETNTGQGQAAAIGYAPLPVQRPGIWPIRPSSRCSTTARRCSPGDPWRNRTLTTSTTSWLPGLRPVGPGGHVGQDSEPAPTGCYWGSLP